MVQEKSPNPLQAFQSSENIYLGVFLIGFYTLCASSLFLSATVATE